MDQFIIVSKDLELNLFTINFLNREIERLHKKNYDVGIYYNNTTAILVRNLDDTIFWTTNFDLLHYIEGNRSSVDEIKKTYPFYEHFPSPRFKGVKKNGSII